MSKANYLADLTFKASFLGNSTEEEREELYTLQYKIGLVLRKVLDRTEPGHQVTIFTHRDPLGGDCITAIFNKEKIAESQETGAL